MARVGDLPSGRVGLWPWRKLDAFMLIRCFTNPILKLSSARFSCQRVSGTCFAHFALDVAAEGGFRALVLDEITLVRDPFCG